MSCGAPDFTQLDESAMIGLMHPLPQLFRGKRTDPFKTRSVPRRGVGKNVFKYGTTR